MRNNCNRKNYFLRIKTKERMMDVKKEKKGNRGITLVALVITIIVLIILAGITLSSIVGPDGIITKAQEAKQNMANAVGEEKEYIDYLTNELLALGGEEGENPDTTNYLPVTINVLLDSYNTTLGEFPMVFKVKTVSQGEIVYEDVVSMQVTGAGNTTLEVPKVGPEGSKVTVEVMYSGANYDITTDTAISVDLGKDAKTEFGATYNGGLVSVSSVENNG